jgi:hypothetical protein
MSYQTTGITWWADYNLVFAPGDDANSGTLDVGAWVSILNQSGGSYEDAKLKLVAGDVNRAPQPKAVLRAGAGDDDAAGVNGRRRARGSRRSPSSSTTSTRWAGPRPSRRTRPSSSSCSSAARAVPADKVLEKVFVYDGSGRFKPSAGRSPSTSSSRTTRTNGLGIPCPQGRIRVSQLDPADGSLEFVGEDTIDHTAARGEISIKLGNAFDIVGERRVVEANRNTDRKVMTQTSRSPSATAKDEPVDVVVLERLGYTGGMKWKITQQSHDFEKKDATDDRVPGHARAR